MIVQNIINIIEDIAPLSHAENFDNVGLLVGDFQMEVTGVLVTLDTLEDVIEEAITKKANVIVSFHPIIFYGIKSLTGKNYVERVIFKAITNYIAIYAVHTALDNSFYGVNAKICEKLHLTQREILIPKPGIIKKLSTYVPKKEADKVRNALFAAKAGTIGNYTNCSFNNTGMGTYLGNENSNPNKGKKGKQHWEEEVNIQLVFDKKQETNVLNALRYYHPYEEIAYEITSLDNPHPYVGLGMLGELEKAEEATSFLERVKNTMQCGIIRHSAWLDKKIKKVAVLGGSGAFAIPNAIAKKADIFLTSDLKYHDFFKAENQIILADIGHYESEQFTKNLLVEYLRKKITTFGVYLSEKNTNPVKYF